MVPPSVHIRLKVEPVACGDPDFHASSSSLINRSSGTYSTSHFDFVCLSYSAKILFMVVVNELTIRARFCAASGFFKAATCNLPTLETGVNHVFFRISRSSINLLKHRSQRNLLITGTQQHGLLSFHIITPSLWISMPFANE